METGYRDDEPTIGQVHSAHVSLESITEFIEDQQDGLFGDVEIFEIWGEVMQDDGTPDGLYIKVEGYVSHWI